MEDPGKKPDAHIVEVEFNQQQEVVLKQLAIDGKYGKDYAEIIRSFSGIFGPDTILKRSGQRKVIMTQYGEKREDIVVQPVSGKALEVYKGEVLRIIQVEGAQCVDFNAFNLHDYKEYLGVSNTRSQHGFRPKKGDIVWSVQSRTARCLLS